MLTQKRLQEVFDYDKETGIFVRKIGNHKIKHILNCVAGSKNDQGYLYIQVDGVRHSAHRLAWLYVYGEWPKNSIDHINRNTSDNRIENLRDVTHSINMTNKSKYKNNKTGVAGINFNNRVNKYQCRKTINGKRVSIGYFEKFEDALNAMNNGIELKETI